MSKPNSISKVGASRQCELCGGAIQSSNRYGVCMRTKLCALERRRRYEKTNRERINAQQRLRRKANPERAKATDRRNREVNRERINAQRRLRREVNRERINAQHRLWCGANRGRMRAASRRYYRANCEGLRAYARLYAEANRETTALKGATKLALRGGIPQSEMCGSLSPNWRGGEMMYCTVPGCHRRAGWRKPSQIKENKTGYRCSVHKNACLPKLKEQDYEYQTPEELQSSMA